MNEPVMPENRPVRMRLRRRGIYLLPNVVTIAALFCGFYAIVMSLNMTFHHATIAIILATILDSMDGRIARITRTQSEFGAQLDSLSDMVSFGVAPALVMYEWSLKGMGRLGWAAAFIYCACAALRLARFNTNITVVNKRYFQGLPSPAAAGMIAAFIWLMEDLGYRGKMFEWESFVITLYAGLTMVTNAPFYSFKDMNRKIVPFIGVIVFVPILVAISLDPPKVLFSLSVVYGLSGYFVYAWRKIKGKPVSIIETEIEPLDLSEHK